MKKFELTSETKVVGGKTLYRIRALIAFGNVDAGELGGWVEEEKNLSHYGNAWVSGNAWVYGDAKVYGNAWVYGNARVYGNALVTGDAEVYGDVWVYGNALVTGDAEVYGDARVYGNAEVYGRGDIFWISGIGSRNGTTTFFACKDKKIRVACGCFFGTIDEFSEKVQRTHEDNEHGKVYVLAVEMAKVRIGSALEGREDG